MHSRRIALVLASLLMTALILGAQNAPAVKPISQSGLQEALRIGGLTTQELVDIVRQRGVTFQMTDQVETELRTAGAETALIEAIRANYRSPIEKPPANLGPLSKTEIATLIDVGTPSARIQQIVTQRGVNFAMTDVVRAELAAAGADTQLLMAVGAAAAKFAGTSPDTAAAPAPAPKTQPADVTNTPQKPPKRLASLKEVQKLYVDNMSNKLDEYLRIELSRQLPGRFLLVQKKEEADALLLGKAQEQTGMAGKLGLGDSATAAVSIVDMAGTVLWASEAGDGSVLSLQSRGPRGVANRLVQALKKTLDAVD